MAELSLTVASLNAAVPPDLRAEVAKVQKQTNVSQSQHVAATKAIEEQRKVANVEQTKKQLAAAKAYATSVDNRKTDMVVTADVAPAMTPITPTSVEHIPEFGADEDAILQEAWEEEMAMMEREAEKADLAAMYQELQNGNLDAETQQAYMEALVADYEMNEDSEFEVIYGFSGKPISVVPKPKTGMDWLKASGAIMWDGMEVVGGKIYDAGAAVVDAFGTAISAKGEEIAKAGEQFGEKWGECGDAWANIFNASNPAELGANLVTAVSATVALATSAIDVVMTTLDPTFISDAFAQLGLDLPIDTGLFTQSLEGIIMRAIDDPSSLANIGDVMKKTGFEMLTKATGGLTHQASSLVSKGTKALTAMVGNSITKGMAGMAMTKMNSALSAKVMSTANGMSKRIIQRATTKVTNRVVSAIRDKVMTLPCCGKNGNPVMRTIVNQITLGTVNAVRNSTDAVRRNTLNTMINAASMNISYEDVALRRAQVAAAYNRAVITREMVFAHMATSSF